MICCGSRVPAPRIWTVAAYSLAVINLVGVYLYDLLLYEQGRPVDAYDGLPVARALTLGRGGSRRLMRSSTARMALLAMRGAGVGRRRAAWDDELQARHSRSGPQSLPHTAREPDEREPKMRGRVGAWMGSAGARAAGRRGAAVRP